MSDAVNWVFGSPTGTPSLWYAAIALLAVLVILASSLVLAIRRRLFPGHSLHARLVRRFATVGIVLGAAGLLLVGAVYLGVPFFSLRLWLILLGVAGLAFLAYLGFFFRRRYPALRSAHDAQEARQRFVRPLRPARPASSGGGGGARRRSKKRR